MGQVQELKLHDSSLKKLEKHMLTVDRTLQVLDLYSEMDGLVMLSMEKHPCNIKEYF